MYFLENNFTEHQFLRSFDTEQEAIDAGINQIREFVKGVNGDLEAEYFDYDGSGSGGEFSTEDEIIQFFKKNKKIYRTDGVSFENILEIIKIKTSDLPQVYNILKENTGVQSTIEYDGNKISADYLYGFDKWDEIKKLAV